MFAAGCLPSLVDGEVTSPELDVFGMGEPRALMGCASFSLSFNFGSQYESPSLPHATLSFAVGEVLVALKLEAGAAWTCETWRSSPGRIWTGNGSPPRGTGR